MVLGVQKLKLEIASLQEQLNESSYTDIQTIQTKLRTTILEMQKIKDHNVELKDRVQSLEDRLYTTLQREILLNDELEKHYAHIQVVVAFLVVSFFGFWVITRHHEGVER